jgi:small subunit ribosomal protein S17
MSDETSETSRAARKSRVGKVVSDKMTKTRIVAVERKVADRMYSKKVAQTKKYYAHDEENASHAGDMVRIMETRPLSKTKRWRIVEVLEQAK